MEPKQGKKVLDHTKKLADELMQLELKAKNTKLPKEWFWSKESVKIVHILVKGIEKWYSEAGYFDKRDFDDFNHYKIQQLSEQIEQLLKTLNEHLKKIEGENYFYTPEEAEFINNTLFFLDSDLSKICEEFKDIEIHEGSESLKLKLKYLMQYRLNPYRQKRVAIMFLIDWRLFKDVCFRMDESSAGGYASSVWMMLPLFFDLIFDGMTPGQLARLDNVPFEKVHFVKYMLDPKVKLRFGLTVRFLASIITQSTIGEHLGARVMGNQLPLIKSIMGTPEGLVVLTEETLKLNKIHKGAPLLIVSEIMPYFAYLFKKNKKGIFESLNHILVKVQDIHQINYLIGIAAHFKEFIDTPKKFETIVLKLYSVDKIWERQRATMDKDAQSYLKEERALNAVLGKITQNKLPIKIDFLFYFIAKANIQQLYDFVELIEYFPLTSKEDAEQLLRFVSLVSKLMKNIKIESIQKSLGKGMENCESLNTPNLSLSMQLIILILECYRKGGNLVRYLDEHPKILKIIVQFYLKKIPETVKSDKEIYSFAKNNVKYDEIQSIVGKDFFGDMFPDDELKEIMGKVDLRTFVTRYPENVKEMIKLAHNIGEDRYVRQYVFNNIKSLKRMKREFKIKLKMWLGYDQLHLLERVLTEDSTNLSPDEQKEKLRLLHVTAFKRLMLTIFSNNIFLAEFDRSKLEKDIGVKAAQVLQKSSKLFVEKEALITHLEKKENNDMISPIIHKAIIPKIKSDNKMKKMISEAKYQTFLAARGELEQTAEAIEKVLKGKTEKGRQFIVSFNVSKKFPFNLKLKSRWIKGLKHFTQPSVLTIGNDGGCCVAMGGINEFAAYNFFNDSDALLINIMDNNKRRIGMVLAFAVVLDNKPCIAINTVETPLRYDNIAYGKICDVSMKMLSAFAHEAGFHKVVIGDGYGSGYFHKAYPVKDMNFEKMNPVNEEKRNYTNAFNSSKEKDGKTILCFKGKAALIWDKKEGIKRNELAISSIDFNRKFKIAA